jgi:hypothetical protein
MRVAFGLVSLLVVLAIILLVFNFYEAPMLKQSKTTRQQAQQIAGRDEDNAPVTDAITLDAQDRNGRMEGAVVTDIVANSALQQKYGLQKGDVILELGDLPVKEYMSSPGEAKDFLLKAYQENRPVVVMRGPVKLSLPQEAPARNAAASAAPPPVDPLAPASAQPQQTAQAPDAQQPTQPKPAQKKPGGLQGPLELIKGAGQQGIDGNNDQ